MNGNRGRSIHSLSFLFSIGVLFGVVGQIDSFCLFSPTNICTEQYFRLFFGISAAQFVAVGQIATEWLHVPNNSSYCGCRAIVMSLMPIDSTLQAKIRRFRR